MNWITKFIKPKIKSLFKKKTSSAEETLWISCECKNLIYKEDFKLNFYCCTKCGAHHKLSCKERFKLFFDNGAYEVIDAPIPIVGIFTFFNASSTTFELVASITIAKNPEDSKTWRS